MFSFLRKKGIVSLVIDDGVMRLVENNGYDLASIRLVAEKPIEKGLIENGRIMDEPRFFDFMKTTVEEWGISKRQVRFFIPQALIILREVELPADLDENIRDYIEFEIGNTIPFPFKNPIFDIYSKKVKDQKVTILAAPEEEVLKYTHTLLDASLKPILAEIQSLAIYRYYLHKNSPKNNEKAYMIIENNVSATNISIFYRNQLEFLRHQPMNISKNYWEYSRELARFQFVGDERKYQGELEELLIEIDRIRNFYRFSIQHGEQDIDEMIVVGDSPNLEQVANLIEESFQIKVNLLDVDQVINEETIDRSFIPALGLALRGGN